MEDKTIFIVGLITTLIASAIPQILYWRNSKQSEDKRRRWQLDDVLRDKKMQILENRIEKINLLAEALAESFQNKRLSFIQFLMNPTNNDEEMPECIFDAMKNTIALQKEFYAITPMIISLDFKTTGLVEIWEKLIDLDARLIEAIIKETKELKHDEFNSNHILLTLSELKTMFNLEMARFFDEIDSMRINTINEYIKISP